MDGQRIPGESEHVSSIMIALASVLSIQLIVELEDEDMEELCERIHSGLRLVLSFESPFGLVVMVLKLSRRTRSLSQVGNFCHQSIH